MVLEEFHVIMRCPTCGVLAEAWPDEVPSADLTADTAHDAEITEEIYLDCKRCTRTFPVTIRAHFGGWEVFLTYDPSEFGTIEHYDYRHDAEPLPEPGSYDIFLNGIKEWRYNVANIGESNGESSRNRMLFTTLYSIVEAYFSDRITSIALSDAAVRRHLLKLDGLKDKHVTLETVLDNPDIVRDMVKTTLQGVSFHNLKLVNWICRAAFGKSILPKDDGDRALIMNSVDKRHDCVHRNGLDQAGNKHTDITREYLQYISSILEAMAGSLEEAVRHAAINEVESGRWRESDLNR